MGDFQQPPPWPGFELLVDILLVQFSRFDEIKDTFLSLDVVTTDSPIGKSWPIEDMKDY